MLVRDAPELQVFMLRRNLRSRFVAGAYLFPGGAVDADDAAPELLARAHGIDATVADERLAIGPGALRFWVAAIRESFEEAGVLLARDSQTGEPIDVGHPESATGLDRDRRALIAGERTFFGVVRDRDLLVDAGALDPVARWITPPGAPRRYDTWFFVAAAPDGHAYLHDDDETVASTWIRPADALERARREEIQLIFPTYRSLQVLAGYRTVSELVGDVRAAWLGGHPLRRVTPEHGWMLDLDGSDHADDLADALTHSTATGGRRSRTR